MPRFLRVQLPAVLAAAVALAAPCLARGIVLEKVERVRPAVSKLDAAGALRVSFVAQGREYRLRLVTNPRLARWTAGSPVGQYAGVLEGVPGSWARLAVGEGSVDGVIFDGRELLVVEPGEGAQAHVFRLADSRYEPRISFQRDTVVVPASKQDPGAPTAAPRVEGISAVRVLEVSALGDAQFRTRYASEQAARDAMLTRLNIADGIFAAEVGVAIEVTSINLGDALSDSLADSVDPPLLLDSLGRLRQQTPALYARGLTHLFTGRDLDSNSVGIAYSGTLCNVRYSASLTQAHNSATVDGLISAHEMGHVFGAPHDGEDECASTSPTQFIMAPSLNPQATSFSQCSLDQMAPRATGAACLSPLLPPDLALSGLGSHEVRVGGEFDWRIDLVNQGERVASDARVTVQVTPALTMVSATVDGGTCVPQASGAICDLATVNAGASVQMHFVVRSQAAGTFTAQAQVVAADDANRDNDSANGTLVVQGGQTAPPEPSPEPTPAPAGRSGGGAMDALLLGVLAMLLGYLPRVRRAVRGARIWSVAGSPRKRP